MTERNNAQKIIEKAKHIGRIAAVITVVGSAGYGTLKASEYLDELDKREIDARCGGPSRKGCMVIDEVVCGVDPGPWGGFPSCETFVEFVPKESTPFAVIVFGSQRDIMAKTEQR